MLVCHISMKPSMRSSMLIPTPQGGGHSLLTPSFGLGVDNLLEMDIVTPDAKLQTISECSNPELFWAVSRPWFFIESEILNSSTYVSCA